MGRAANKAPAPPPTDDAEDDARGDDDGLGTHLAVVLDPLLRAPLVEALKRPLALSQRHGVASGRRLCRAGLAHRPQGSSGQPRRAPVDVACARANSPTGRPARKFVRIRIGLPALWLSRASQVRRTARPPSTPQPWVSALSTPCSGSPPRVSSVAWPWPLPRRAPSPRTASSWPSVARRCVSQSSPSSPPVPARRPVPRPVRRAIAPFHIHRRRDAPQPPRIPTPIRAHACLSPHPVPSPEAPADP